MPKAPAQPKAKNPSAPTTPYSTGQGPSLPSGPTTPGSAPTDLSKWDIWWDYNQHEYLDLKAHVLGGQPESQRRPIDAGAGTSVQRTKRAVSDDDVRDVIGPALLRAFEEESSVDTLNTSMFALAKLHPVYQPIEGAPLRERFSAHLSHSNLEVTETATIALGMLGDAQATRVLCDLVRDNKSGRALLQREKVPAHTRPMAALALGLAGARSSREEVRRYIVHNLVQVYEADHSATPDLRVACITSLGLIPLARTGLLDSDDDADLAPPSSSREAQLEFLARVLAARKTNRVVRSHVPKSIGLLAASDPELARVAGEALLDTFGEGRRLRAFTEYGLTTGLGMVGDADEDPHDRDLRMELKKRLKEGDAFERSQVLIALASVGSRAGQGRGQADDAWAEFEALLAKQFTRGKSTVRPWAALALGVEGHHRLAQELPISEATSRKLRQRLEQADSPSEVGALSIALGLRRYQQATPILMQHLDELRDDRARGHVAIALGLLGAHEAIPELRALLAESTKRPTLVKDTAIALALLDDKDVVDQLLEILVENRSSYVLSAAVLAIGHVGDARIVAPLVALLEDSTQSEVTRRFAAVALGVACERELLPWTSMYTADLNYSAVTDTLLSHSGQGLLNMR